MISERTKAWRIAFTALVLVAEAAHLGWEHFHGGIASHHFLDQADMPAFSNLWGLLLLPALSWFLSGAALRRPGAWSTGDAGAGARLPRLSLSLIAGFTGALSLGVALAMSFAQGHPDISSWLFQGMLVAALLLPVYRAEYLLGFVLGMTFTFGAVLPTIIGAGVAALSALAHRLLYPVALRLWWRVVGR